MQQIIIILLIPILFCLDVASLIHAKQKHFDVDLVHRDSVLLSQYNNSITSRKASRSFNEVDHFNSTTDVNARYVETMMGYTSGEYLMSLSLGNSYKALLLISLASDLIWLNCEPGEISHHQDGISFTRSDRSETYSELRYTDELCQSKGHKWPGQSGECIYKYDYATPDDYTAGIMCKESFILGSTNDDFVDLVFGCSDGTTIQLPSRAHGMVGLGGGDLSLVSQLSEKIDHKFSYCMVPEFGNSKLRLGYEEENFFGTRTVSTSFELKPPMSYYYLKLKLITISGEYISIDQHDITINPTVPMMHLHSNIYEQLITIILDKVGTTTRVRDTSEQFNLCFKTSEFGYRFSPIMFHFGDAQVRLEHDNIFVNNHDGKTCLAIFPNDNMSIFGTIAQYDIQVDYDLQAKTVSFTQRDCTTF